MAEASAKAGSAASGSTDGSGSHLSSGLESVETLVLPYSDRCIRGGVEEYVRVQKRVLGTGMSGPVRLALRHSDGARCALKRFPKEWLFPVLGLVDEIVRNEIYIHLGLEHPNIVKLERVYENEGDVCMVMKCLDGGDLFERVRKTGPFSEAEAAKTLRQILEAVDYLHGQGVAHRDLKPDNLVYEDESYTCLKLIDFGFAARCREGQKLKDNCGTLEYQAPEVFSGEHTCKADMWSLGIIAHFLLCGKAPWIPCDNEAELERRVKSGNVYFSSSHFGRLSTEAKSFIRALLQKDESLRLDASVALQHPFLQKQTSIRKPPARGVSRHARHTTNMPTRPPAAADPASTFWGGFSLFAMCSGEDHSTPFSEQSDALR